jgi:hypothetical protein
VFVLCNGEYLLFGQATQSDAIFKRYHSFRHAPQLRGVTRP